MFPKKQVHLSSFPGSNRYHSWRRWHWSIENHDHQNHCNHSLRCCVELMTAKRKVSTPDISEHRVHARRYSSSSSLSWLSWSIDFTFDLFFILLVQLLIWPWSSVQTNQSPKYVENSENDFQVIRRDIARTYPEHALFKQKDGVGQESLFNVMKAYSVHDREVMIRWWLWCCVIILLTGWLLSGFSFYCWSSIDAGW